MQTIPFQIDYAKITPSPDPEQGIDWDTDQAALMARLELGESLDEASYRQSYEGLLSPLIAEFSQPRYDQNLEPIEEQLVRVFRFLADHLLANRQPGFSELVEAINALSFNQAVSQQWQSYYNGVDYLQAEKYELADRIFGNLLTEGGLDNGELDDTVRGRVLNSHSNCLRVAGQYEQALQGFQESLAIWRRLDDKVSAGKALLNMGTTAYYLQSYDDAATWFSNAAAFFAETDQVVLLGASQNGLGLVHRDQGRWEEALTSFSAYIASGEECNSPDVIGTGKLNVAEILLFQGRISEAISTLEETLSYMERRIHRVDVYINLGLAYQALEELGAARVAFQQAADLAYEIERREILPHVEYRLGLIAQQAGDQEGARLHLTKAVGFIEASREPIDDEGLKISLLGTWQQIYEALVLHLLDMGEPQQAFAWAERARARAFGDGLLKHTADTDSNTGSNVNTGGESGCQPSLEDLQKTIPDTATEATAILAYYTTGVLDSDIPMVRAIPKENPLRKYLLTPARTILFLIESNRFSAIECTIDPNLFSMMSPRGYDLNRWLDEAVLDHLVNSLLNVGEQLVGIQNVYIIPHGPLHLVPFAALCATEGGKSRGLDSAVLTYAPSATILYHSQRIRQQHGQADRWGIHKAEDTLPTGETLSIGYNGERHGQRLQFTEAEVSAVAKLMEGESYIGGEPKKEAILKLVETKRWLHFACHGWFNHDSPLDSYLETGQNERLMAQEIMETWRLRAELVTLSACQTGVSRVLRGDEPMGLVRAFLYAGAKSVLVSQWPVEDLPTFLLMQRFYTVLAQARSTQALAGSKDIQLSAILSAAQKWLRNLKASEAEILINEQGLMTVDAQILTDAPSDSSPFAHPRYWAAFILVAGG